MLSKFSYGNRGGNIRVRGKCYPTFPPLLLVTVTLCYGNCYPTKKKEARFWGENATGAPVEPLRGPVSNPGQPEKKGG